MKTQLLNNCDNCGAKLESITDTTSNGIYCGSLCTIAIASIPTPELKGC